MRSHLKQMAFGLFAISWLLMATYLVVSTAFSFHYRMFNAYQDVSRRVTSPDGTRTATLVRDLGYPDLNFKLYISGPSRAVHIYVADPTAEDSKPTLVWFSRDYEPTTLINWHEEIDWSADSSLVVVTIEGQFVFAYDVRMGQKLEDATLISQLLAERGGPQPTRTPSPSRLNP